MKQVFLGFLNFLGEDWESCLWAYISAASSVVTAAADAGLAREGGDGTAAPRIWAAVELSLPYFDVVSTIFRRASEPLVRAL
mmetsp:Transcript_18208/g.61888  ORF Transcript_18208/g.61888 Transcript_18208/m.61888 type:complete len:82 (+) Transcript_18208:4028-4273(+)